MAKPRKLKASEKLAELEKGKRKGYPSFLFSVTSLFFSFMFALSQFSGPDYLKIPVFDEKEKQNKNDSPCVFVLLLSVSLLVELFGSRFIDA